MTDLNQKDLVLSINEYAYILDQTKGAINCAVGPYKTSLSQSDTPVRFDTKTKKFIPCHMTEAIQLFCSAPENWYCILKNPIKNGKHPSAGTSNMQPEDMEIGKKINIQGPVSFALYPGQMAKVIQGHRLKSNQYLVARVYDAESANQNSGVMTNAEGENVVTNNKYTTGQLIIIKGTEVAFYIPPTGIEVVKDDNGNFVRDAVTLERLEYCILKDEDGNKRYFHGPDVVFPEPTETFVESRGKSHSYIFRAIELSKISGLYIKVIADYDDEKGVHHPIGEELFITGNEQMIYYPRPEHAIINYDNKYVHHAIAIPKGEGRYIMNRLTGEIKTVAGPAMYLPDPRTEVVVRRKLSEDECRYWFPGNAEVLDYNIGLSEKSVEKSLRQSVDLNFLNSTVSYSNATLAAFESNASISRGTSYTKPRTITLDTKYEGVVGINVWTGYAVNIISKNGDRNVIVGPAPILLDYDQTLENVCLSTGTPKTERTTITTPYLKVSNNRVSDKFVATTKDLVSVTISVSYYVDFLKSNKDKWFNINNYTKFLTDFMRVIIKNEVNKYEIKDFYANAEQIISNIILNKVDNAEAAESDRPKFEGRFFNENGMLINNVDINYVEFDSDIEEMLKENKISLIEKTLKYEDSIKEKEVAKQLAMIDRENLQIIYENKKFKQEQENQLSLDAIDKKKAIQDKETALEMASFQAKKDVQAVLTAIEEAQNERTKARNQVELDNKKAMADLEKAKKQAYAETVEKIMSAISPDLVAAITTSSNADMLKSVAENISPYAIANDQSVADFTNKLLRGTSLENIFDKTMNN